MAAGATADELFKLESGGYSRAFVAKIVAWYNMRQLVDSHIEDEKGKAIKRKAK